VTRLSSLLAVAGCLLLASCGSSGPPRVERLSTVAVSGVLTFNGTPLESHRVTFYPIGGDRPANGVTDAAGKFTLGTNEPGDGCPVGKYKVSISFSPTVQADYSTDGGIEDPAKMPKPKVKIPVKYADPETSGVTQEITGSVSDLKIDLQ